MNVDTIHTVRQATDSVLDSYGFTGARMEEVLVCPNSCSRSGAVGVSVCLTGDLSGILGFVFPSDHLPEFSGQIVRTEVTPEQIGEQHDIAAEFANIVAGNAMGQLYGFGLGVDISPPTVVQGQEVVWCFPEGADSVVIPVFTDQGRFEVVLSILPP